jgi:hypothetical protein
MMRVAWCFFVGTQTYYGANSWEGNKLTYITDHPVYNKRYIQLLF